MPRQGVLDLCHKNDGWVECGDAFDLIEKLPPETVDLVITSPPYWGLRSYNLEHDWNIARAWRETAGAGPQIPDYDWYRRHGGVLGLEPLPEWYIAHLVEILQKTVAALKKTGSLWVNIGDTYFARWSSIRDAGRQGLGSQERSRRRTPMGGFRQEKQLLLIPARFAIAMQERRWILRNDLIWHKPNATPGPENDRLRLAHEHFFHFVKRPTKGRAKYYYDRRFVEPSGADVIRCAVRPGENGHTATFPIELVRPRILSSCPPGGLVLDPFCGTGRVLEIALANQRRAIGFDLVNEYVQTTRDKLRDLMNADRSA